MPSGAYREEQTLAGAAMFQTQAGTEETRRRGVEFGQKKKLSPAQVAKAKVNRGQRAR